MAAAAGDEPPAAAPIEPTSFDVVICGTGFPESVLAAACAAAGKTVLHVDPNASYGSLYASSLSSFLLDSDSSASRPDTAVHRRSDLYSDLETSGTAPEPAGGFTVDLVGPRLLYCADEAVDLLLRSGASNHVEFKSLDGGTLLYWDGHLCPVPDSRNAIFLLQDTNNTTRIQRLIQKNRLNTFFKLVESHIAAAPSSPAGKTMISEEDLNLPFVEFLKKQQLPPKMIAVVLYAITMADYDQDAAADSCENLVTTRDGIKAIALYNQSIGRYPNAKGAFIYPMYGHGELPQAFCRFAAVKGALYVLRMPVTALLMDKEKQRYIGTRLASGQDILCQKLILDPSYKIPSLDLPSDASDSNSPRKVARGICIITKPVKKDSSNVLVVFPPKSLLEQQVAAIQVLQLSSNVAICPPGMFIAYLSIPCADAFTGKLCINKAIEVLFSSQASYGSEAHVDTTSKDNEDAKPVLIWNCVYVQEISQGTSGIVLSCPKPDEYLDYRKILESTKKLFADIYPNEEFLPRNSAPKYADDDSDSAE